MAQVALRFNLSGLILSIIPQRPVIAINTCPESQKVTSITYSTNQGTYRITPDTRVVEIDSANNLQRQMYRSAENKIKKSLAKDCVRQGIPFPQGFEFLQKDYDYREAPQTIDY